MANTIDKASKAKEILAKIKKSKQNKSESIKPFAGKLKSDIDPLQFQKQARDEWR